MAASQYKTGLLIMLFVKYMSNWFSIDSFDDIVIQKSP